jgi:hypothetical protein
MNKMKDFGGDPSEEGVACPTLLHQVVGGYTSPLIHQYQSKCDDGAGNSLRYCFEWLAPSNQNSVAAAATVVFAPTFEEHLKGGSCTHNGLLKKRVGTFFAPTFADQRKVGSCSSCAYSKKDKEKKKET